MTFLPPAEHDRRFRAAMRARATELVALGISPLVARAQAQQEFSIYDCIEIDERGWIRVDGLELPPLRARTERSR